MGRWKPIKGFSRTPGADRFALANPSPPPPPPTPCPDCGYVGEHTDAVCVKRVRAALTAANKRGFCTDCGAPHPFNAADEACAACMAKRTERMEPGEW